MLKLNRSTDRAFLEIGEFVFTFMPFMTGIAHEATGC